MESDDLARAGYRLHCETLKRKEEKKKKRDATKKLKLEARTMKLNGKTLELLENFKNSKPDADQAMTDVAHRTEENSKRWEKESFTNLTRVCPESNALIDNPVNLIDDDELCWTPSDDDGLILDDNDWIPTLNPTTGSDEFDFDFHDLLLTYDDGIGMDDDDWMITLFSDTPLPV